MCVGSYTGTLAAEPQSDAAEATAPTAKTEEDSGRSTQRALAHAFLIGFAVGGIWLCKRWYSSRNESAALTQDGLRESLERLKKQGEQPR